MKDYNYKNLRNVGLIGHGATGKTSLAEALLFYTNNTDRLGKVEDGTTVMDYEQEEKKRGISLSTSIASFEENNTKINIIQSIIFGLIHIYQTSFLIVVRHAHSLLLLIQ